MTPSEKALQLISQWTTRISFTAICIGSPSLAAVLVLTGCGEMSPRAKYGFHAEPSIMYDDKTYPLSETAVFSAADFGEVVGFDGKVIRAFIGLYPKWVRVQPGTHSFQVRYVKAINRLTSEITYVVVNVGVKDMKPRHVYNANFRKFHIVVESLGPNPAYAPLGMPSVQF